MAEHVFVCYARADQGFVRALVEELKAAGASVWMDQTDIRPGADWDRAIDTALRNCASLLIVLSQASVDSEEVRSELRTALDAQKPVIPVLRERCEIPRQLRLRQYVSFEGRSPHDPECIAQVLRAMRPPGGTRMAAVHRSTARPHGRAWLYGAVGVVLAIGIVLAALRLGPQLGKANGVDPGAVRAGTPVNDTPPDQQAQTTPPVLPAELGGNPAKKQNEPVQRVPDAAPGQPQRPDPRRPEAGPLSEGIRLLEAHRPADALPLLERAVSIRPRNPVAHYQLAFCRMRLNDCKAAVAGFDRAIELDDSKIDFFLRRAEAKACNHQEREALADYQRVIRTLPDDPRAYSGRAKAYWVLQQYRDAGHDYLKVTQLEPNNADAWERLAHAMAKTGDTALANRYLQKARSLRAGQ